MDPLLPSLLRRRYLPNRSPALDFETFRLFDGDSSLSNLDQNLTINGTTVSPGVRVDGANGTTLAWTATVGGDFSINGSGNDVTPNQSTPLTDDSDKGVLFNGGKHYVADDAAAGQPGTDDFVVELVYRQTLGTAGRIWTTRNATRGYELYANNGANLAFFVRDASGFTTVTLSNALSAGAWYHVILFADRSGSVCAYINGVQSTTGSISARSGSITSAQNLLLGAYYTGTNVWTSDIAYAAMWSRDNWLNTHLQVDLAAERFYKLTGFWPSRAKGISAPTVASRASAAHLDIWRDEKVELHQVGTNWMRLCRRRDDGGTPKLLTGYLAEEARTNVLADSDDFTAWTELDAGDTTAANSLIADATDGPHGWTDTATLSATSYTLAVDVKAGAESWLYLSDDTVANADAYFNLQTGVVGTVGAAATAAMRYLGEGEYRYRCWITFTGTAAVHTLRVAAAEADGDASFAGDGSTVTLYAGRAQCEAGAFPSSPIYTSGASAARVKDQLQYVAGDNLGGEDVSDFTLYSEFLVRNEVPAATKVIAAISDGGASADTVELYLGSGGVLQFGSSSTAEDSGSAFGATDLTDGKVHQGKYTFAPDDLRIYEDESQVGVTDTAVGVPDGLDEMDIGQGRTSAAQFNGVLSNVRIHKKALPSKVITAGWEDA